MLKRVFVAVNLPSEIKKLIAEELSLIKRKFQSREIRFINPENWHITISFLGYQSDESVNAINESLQTVAGQYQSCKIKLEKIVYGPPKAPRMIWLVAAASEKLSALKSDLEKKLVEKSIRFKRENRPFTAHITLARFARTGRKQLPEIEKNLDWQFEVKSLELMQSVLKPTGAEYGVLTSFNLARNELS